jgi:hypothetical protein
MEQHATRSGEILEKAGQEALETITQIVDQLYEGS